MGKGNAGKREVRISVVCRVAYMLHQWNVYTISWGIECNSIGGVDSMR